MKNQMKSQSKLILLSAALAAFALPVVAQSNDASASGQTNSQTVQQRKDNQQDRIANGVKNGELTTGETTNLERKEANLNQEEHDMRSMDKGQLTAADKATLNQQQSNLSHQIYNDKHNAATQTADPKSEVGQRAENQQDRIAQGVKSGQLTAGETSNLEKNEAKINNEMRNDRAADGGKLTPAEKAKVNRQQNRESRQIYRDKHNARVR
jgi:hypothetical protein